MLGWEGGEVSAAFCILHLLQLGDHVLRPLDELLVTYILQ